MSWITAKEAAAYLDLPLSRVYIWVREGVLEGIKRGRSMQISLASIERALKQGRVDKHKKRARVWPGSRQLLQAKAGLRLTTYDIDFLR